MIQVAADGGREPGGGAELLQAILEGRVILAELDREAHARGFQAEMIEQGPRLFCTLLHRCGEVHVHPRVAKPRRQPGEIGPADLPARHQCSIQGNVHAGILATVVPGSRPIWTL